MAQTMFERYGGLLTGHTFVGHTAGCAAGVAVQRIVERERLVERVAADSPGLFARLNETLGQHPNVGDIRGRGFFAGIELVADRESKAPFDPALAVFGRIRDQAFANGLICYPAGGNVDGKRGDQVILAPPYNASAAELDEMVELLAKSVRQVCAALPG